MVLQVCFAFLVFPIVWVPKRIAYDHIGTDPSVLNPFFDIWVTFSVLILCFLAGMKFMDFTSKLYDKYFK